MTRREGECTIREATVSDAATLARLATQLGYPTTEEEACWMWEVGPRA